VAVDLGYECHRCGSTFPVGLVRVPKAWGKGGQEMEKAALTDLPYPEAAVVERDSLDDQSAEIADTLPERPIVLGGCCCAHVGAARGLAGRGTGTRLSVVWLDAHGDLNTPESSPSGNLWGMPLRMLLDDGVVAPEDVALVGARNLDPPEAEYLDEKRIDDSIERALADADAVYVALDLDVLDPSELAVFVPEPNGLSVADLERVLHEIAARAEIAGIGVTGWLPDERSPAVVRRLLAAVGL
jgi:arginase